MVCPTNANLAVDAATPSAASSATAPASIAGAGAGVDARPSRDAPWGRAAIAAVTAIVWAVGIAALLGVATFAAAQPLERVAEVPEGSELLVTDASGARFVGYGQVEGATLRLQLDADAAGWPESLLLTLVLPGGTVESYALRAVAGRLEVEIEGGRPVALERFLAGADVALQIEPRDAAAGFPGRAALESAPGRATTGAGERGPSGSPGEGSGDAPSGARDDTPGRGDPRDDRADDRGPPDDRGAADDESDDDDARGGGDGGGGGPGGGRGGR